MTVAFPMAFFVLDIFHVMERLWTAAHSFHKQGRSRTICNQQIEKVINRRCGPGDWWLQANAVQEEASSIIRYELEKVIGYMERNREHMRYDICLELGYPIGSGAVEGACRNLINDRMELTGMKWSRNGAEATIRLRSVDINGDWEDFWEFYRKKERNRLYPSNPPNLSRNIRRRIETGSVKLSDRK